jgi:hypothetical protein
VFSALSTSVKYEIVPIVAASAPIAKTPATARVVLFVVVFIYPPYYIL